ncbi:anaerobic sulfatase-maturating enzyme [Clostridium saccharobutylicum]|uniref:Cys-rich peptide radical SAM maturase CcpM n=1 Tax=Clostridium saccharobutylicum TaxID=169679 RepID=UPI000983C1E1|nr:Cys-rich peptide radical SAM maturase CcpM [Clostridium saccharobutylicum]AQS11460.1 anaerobic sulfatase-maturating enzyme [Clostridium saccharobutylicum]MBC2435137.1 Cys-rich peptide radical SAM maturase CcpM [Clostridium saccharobutylicum]NSB88614.1 uncharacterized protein [Clostridium saccharobutylicum]OOM17786.1 anaerobic sulfatase-maturating enzyme [Clostridium saccharobutylicum]
MLKNIPHIHLLKLYDEYYLYDVNTNAIVSIPLKVYEYLQSSLNSDENSNNLYECLDKNLRDGIEYLKSQGMLLPRNENLKIKHVETDLLKDLYENNLRSLTLQVTQNCNLRCSYCVYSGSYVNRTHSNKRMSWEVAKKTIDFFYEHSTNTEEVVFGFYGGEPLLEFELMKKCINYIRELFIGKKIFFTVTTNATLLTEEKIKFLAKNNFDLVISLDGPADVQNKNRIFADEHRGTFEVVMKNLSKVKMIDESFYKRISFNAVIDLKENFSCANEFFLSYDMVKDLNVAGNYVNVTNKVEKIDINTKYYADAQYETFKAYLYHCSNIFSAYKPTLLNNVVNNIKSSMNDRVKVRGERVLQSSPGGQCIPGIQRFFVNVDGEFYPCERVNENADILNIGNIHNGFDINKAKNILNIANTTEEECRKCWCFKICTQCVSMAEEDGELSRKRRLSICSETQKNAEEQIKDYIVLKKYGCDFEKEV